MQDRSRAAGARGFTAFIAWTYKTENTELGGTEVSSSDYLRTQAIARIYLDNIPNIQASWVTQGPKIGQLSLLCGCNDLGSLMMEENVVSAAGTTFDMQLNELRTLITTPGYIPIKRNYYYQSLEPVAS